MTGFIPQPCARVTMLSACSRVIVIVHPSYSSIRPNLEHGGRLLKIVRIRLALHVWICALKQHFRVHLDLSWDQLPTHYGGMYQAIEAHTNLGVATLTNPRSALLIAG